ncbi:MAG: toll/interleukin-1 receptor domain-containing protein [Anaerolineae bacterium]
MADADQLALLRKCNDAYDITQWNDWLKATRKKDPNFIPDLASVNLASARLSGADLSRTDLGGVNLNHAVLIAANLSGASLYEADLRNANLNSADLGWANLKRAKLERANLSGADLHNATLEEQDLRRADLRTVNLHRANLRGADVSGADLDQTMFTDLDLSQVIGLEKVNHLGPSCIDYSTFYKSHGNIPEAFLRGCGVPDELITFVRHQIGSAKAVEFYSAFISYSSKDAEFVRRLHADLQANHVRVWFAPEDLEIGQPIMAGIDAAIRSYDKLMVILSQNSIHSEWVNFEVTNAIDRELKQKRRALFPIRIDDNILRLNEALARDTDPERHEQYSWVNQVCQRHIGDFTQWKERDEYEKAFARLLRDLQAKDPPL